MRAEQSIQPGVVLVMAGQSIGRHRVRALVTLAVLALATAVVVNTVGRTQAARATILAELERPAARLLRVVDQDGQAEIEPASVDRVARMSGVEWVIGLGQVGSLSRNAALADQRGTGNAGAAVGTVLYWGDLSGPATTRVLGRGTRGGEALAGSRALNRLGISGAAGSVIDDGRGLVAIVGRASFIDAIDELNSYVLIRATRDGRPLHELVVLADSVAAADRLATQLGPLIWPADDRSLRVDRAQDLTELRTALNAEVSALDTALLTGTFAVAAVLVSINLFGAIAERRREFGLRRTQGASRSLIAALVMLEVGALAVVGSLVGAVGGLATVLLQTSRLPDPILALTASAAIAIAALIGAMPAAATAAFREPLHALR